MKQEATVRCVPHALRGQKRLSLEPMATMHPPGKLTFAHQECRGSVGRYSVIARGKCVRGSVM